MPETFSLAFAGGGVKAAAFIGAVEVLQRAGHRFHRLVGTSAGAVAATALAVGFNPEEMQQSLLPADDGDTAFQLTSLLEVPSAKDFPPAQRSNAEFVKLTNLIVDGLLRHADRQHVLHQRPALVAAIRLLASSWSQPILLDALLKVPTFAQLYSLLEVGAAFSDRQLVAWIRSQLRRKKWDPEISLQGLYEATRRDLTLVAVDITNREVVVLNHRTAPACPVWAAVRMSLSVPFLWPEVRWQPDWGLYRGQDMSDAAVVDGSVLSNFPMRLVVDPGPEIRAVMGPVDPPRIRPLGLYLDDRKSVPGVEPREGLWSLKIARQAARVVEAASGPWDQEILERYRSDICFIGTRGFQALEFDLDAARLEALVNSGRCAMTDYLTKRGWARP
ncbi:MAG: patatin-like phospholipase family protein [Gemmataceae bacterium]|nr:patatin-like phospholipase family protein [Gemmataceae bacterium]MDW8265550.1 patatin-like phospholipase family protein [Gemmataceae bacterium]